MRNSFMNFANSLRSAFNIFRDRNHVEEEKNVRGSVYSLPQHRSRFRFGNQKTIIGAIYSRISTDVSLRDFHHVRVDENDVFVENIDSGLDSCLSLEANVDQSSRAFIQDVVMSMFDEGVVAMVPVDTSENPMTKQTVDILSMRTAKVVQWYPQHVRVMVYNDGTGEREEITLPKSKVGIIENPFYSVMNDQNSIGQRLISKLNLLDAVDELSGSGKLDLIVQLPYSVKGETKMKMAEQRRKDLQEQLQDSEYGVAYIDGTEKVIQLNRSVVNNLLEQVQFLTSMLYGQLGVSEAILNGTADENEMINYHNRIVSPIATAITSELKRKFISKTARTQGQSIMHFHNFFSFVTPERLADLADKFLRNEIASPNDFRAVVGWKPSKAAGADELRNRNISQPTEDKPMDATEEFNKLKPATKVNKEKEK